MADNFLYIPLANPVRFYAPDRAVTDTYQTPHFDDFPIAERLYAWQTPADYRQLWQTTDIISLQFESTFDPIIVSLLDENDEEVFALPALVGLPNIHLSNTYAYEVEMSLAAVTTGCYRIKLLYGTGAEQDYQLSGWMYISSEPIEGTVLLEYSHNRYHQDIMFESGIEFQLRLPGHFGAFKPARAEERYKDQKYNPTLLSSKSFRQFEFVFGDEFGLPDEMIDLLNRVFSCQNLTIDGKAFCIAEGGQFEFQDVQDYPKRGVKVTIEEGINRGSKIISHTVDTTKKLQYAVMVDAKVFGDTSNQGSSNAVPIITIE